MSFLYWPHFAQAAAKVRGVPFTVEEQETLDAVNALTRREDIVLDTHFEPGDIQYLNNFKILHSRTDYEDWSDPARKRYLERIWLNSCAERTFMPGFADLHGPNSLARGIPSVPSEVLAARGHTVSVS